MATDRPAKPSSAAALPGAPLRIVLSGGPGGGKTTAADLFRREIGDRVVIVPESATLLFGGGFPRIGGDNAIRATQSAIYHVQRNLEDIQAARYPERLLLCDRGTIDGAAYWPQHSDGDQPDKGLRQQQADFFSSLDTTLESELARYDAVLFFDSAALGGIDIEGGNPIRNESLEQAVALNQRLKALWCQHPRFYLVPHNPSFYKKITFALALLESLLFQGTDNQAGLCQRSLQQGSDH